MWLTRLYRRFRDLVHEVGKFGAVGTVAYGIDNILFVLMRVQGVEALTAGAIATIVAASVAFVGNRFWTWRDRARSGLFREYGLYIWFNTVGLVIVLVVLGASHYGLGALWPDVFHSTLADVIAKNVVGLALGTVFRFWAYRRFVFRPAVPRQVTSELTPATSPAPAE